MPICSQIYEVCQFDELWYAVGFDDSSETHYCLADKNMNCKEYLGEDGVENAGCYQSSLSTDSTEILSCGDHHLDVWGCSGYDGCGKGQHWCKYLEENTTRWVISRSRGVKGFPPAPLKIQKFKRYGPVKITHCALLNYFLMKYTRSCFTTVLIILTKNTQ